MLEATSKIAQVESTLDQQQTLQLNSGRWVTVQEGANEDVVEIHEANHQLVLKIRLTEDGPVMVVEGARLELKARQVKIKAEEEITMESGKTMQFNAKEQVTIHSDADIKATGKIIYLN